MPLEVSETYLPTIQAKKTNVTAHLRTVTAAAYETLASRRRFDYRIRVTIALGERRKEGAKYIFTYRHIYIINSGPKGGYRAYMGWGVWGKCAPCHPRSLEWCSKPPCHCSIHAVLHPVRRRCTGRLSSMDKGQWVNTPSNRYAPCTTLAS